MGALQNIIALILLIFVLSVFVQAIQEFVKSALNTKADVMEQTINDFMTQHLTLDQVKNALALRGLGIAALEHFSQSDFRHLLDGITLTSQQGQGVVTAAGDLDAVKTNIAASWDAARARFQKSYTNKNYWWVLSISFIVVISLNANLFMLFDQISEDQVVQQMIVGSAAAELKTLNASDQGSGTQPTNLGTVYANSRQQISQGLQKYPVLIRTSFYGEDFRNPASAVSAIFGLLLMGLLVSLGAPFWNDVLKGTMGLNNALNTTRQLSS